MVGFVVDVAADFVVITAVVVVADVVGVAVDVAADVVGVVVDAAADVLVHDHDECSYIG